MIVKTWLQAAELGAILGGEQRAQLEALVTSLDNQHKDQLDNMHQQHLVGTFSSGNIFPLIVPKWNN